MVVRESLDLEGFGNLKTWLIIVFSLNIWAVYIQYDFILTLILEVGNIKLQRFFRSFFARFAQAFVLQVNIDLRW